MVSASQAQRQYANSLSFCHFFTLCHFIGEGNVTVSATAVAIIFSLSFSLFFLPRDAMLQRGICCRHVVVSSSFLGWRLFSTYRYCAIRKFGYLKIRVLPSGNLPQTVNIENFATASRSRCQQSSSSSSSTVRLVFHTYIGRRVVPVYYTSVSCNRLTPSLRLLWISGTTSSYSCAALTRFRLAQRVAQSVCDSRASCRCSVLVADNQQCPLYAVKRQQEACYASSFPVDAYKDSVDEICQYVSVFCAASGQSFIGT